MNSPVFLSLDDLYCIWRYADHKKTLDKYGDTKEIIPIWVPSHTPHIPKIARNQCSLLPETTLSKYILGL